MESWHHVILPINEVIELGLCWYRLCKLLSRWCLVCRSIVSRVLIRQTWDMSWCRSQQLLLAGHIDSFQWSYGLFGSTTPMRQVCNIGDWSALSNLATLFWLVLFFVETANNSSRLSLCLSVSSSRIYVLHGIGWCTVSKRCQLRCDGGGCARNGRYYAQVAVHSRVHAR